MGHASQTIPAKKLPLRPLKQPALKTLQKLEASLKTVSLPVKTALFQMPVLLNHAPQEVPALQALPQVLALPALQAATVASLMAIKSKQERHALHQMRVNQTHAKTNIPAKLQKLKLLPSALRTIE